MGGWTICHFALDMDAKEIRGRQLSDLRPGGLGTVVISQVFDEVNHVPVGKGNSLTLRKALPQTPDAGGMLEK